MQRITPNIWCNGVAAAAGEFYASVFPDATAEVAGRYPTEGLPDVQREMAGRELVVDVTIGGYRLRLINAGDEFPPNPSISFMIGVDPSEVGGDGAAQALVDRMWSALSVGGQVRMPLGTYPHSPHYGWVSDRYGVNWQLMVSEPGSGGPAVVPQMLFTGGAPQARAAIETYTELFPDSGVGLLMPGDDDRLVAFAQFTLDGQWFSALDGGSDHEFTFTPGVSLEVACADQTEIDRLWEALSAVPDAERCGWLVDAFGVSWQIVPADMATLMQRPGAYGHMLSMGKIVIDDL